MNTIKLNTIGETPVKKVAGGGGGGNFKYFSISEYSDNQELRQWACRYGQYVKYQWHQRSNDESSPDSTIPPVVSGRVVVTTAGDAYDIDWDYIDFLAVAVDMDTRIYSVFENEWVDPKPYLEEWSGVKFSDLKEISKEEFYNINI
jgi:hypothetical protein